MLGTSVENSRGRRVSEVLVMERWSKRKAPKHWMYYRIGRKDGEPQNFPLDNELCYLFPDQPDMVKVAFRYDNGFVIQVPADTISYHQQYLTRLEKHMGLLVEA